MTPFDTLTGLALSLPQDDVDTDIIYPARFLLVTERRGLGIHAFADRRASPDFPIGADGVGDARILVAGRNFGCGSSREQAVWALADLGLRVIVAPSFGEIFYSNCFKSGVLPIRLSQADCAKAHAAALAGTDIRVDLHDCAITGLGAEPVAFQVEEDRRQSLLNGWNEIGRIRALHRADIAAFEARQRTAAPWLWSADRPVG